MSVLDFLSVKDKVLLAVELFLPIISILCFYFTLTFFELLHKSDGRATQYKNYAFLCLVLLFYIPIVYALYKLRF